MGLLQAEDSGPCTKTLTIEVPPEGLKKQTDEIYETLRKEADVPGFRKGKSPREILEMRFGEAIGEEAKGKAMAQAWQSAVEELELHIVGEPDIKEVEEKEDEPVRITVEVQFLPKFELGQYKGLDLAVFMAEVSDEEIDQTIESMRRSQAMMATVEGRPVRKGDHVYVDIEALLEGNPFKEASGKGRLLHVEEGHYLPGLVEALVGKNTGDSAALECQLSDDYEIEEYRGKQAKFEMTITNICERRLPEVDDEFAKDMGGVESLEEFRQVVRKSLESNRETSKPGRVRAAVEDRLLSDHPFEVPPVLLEGEHEYVKAMQGLRLKEIGTSFDALTQKHQQELDDAGKEIAGKRVRLSLLLRKIAEEEKIELSDDELEDYIEVEARREGHDPGRFRIYIENRHMVPYYERTAKEGKVTRFLVDNARVQWVDKEIEQVEAKPAEEPESESETQAPAQGESEHKPEE